MNAYLPQNITIIFSILGYFAVAYILGSIPVAWLLARWKTGSDLRQMGSGNVGVMNTALSVARWAGLIVFLAEISKGVLAVIIPQMLGAGQPLVAVSIIGAVMGTRWPVWLGFKGGRGNTTGLAACALISPESVLLSGACWFAARILLKKSYAATHLTLLALPLIIWLVTGLAWFALTGLALSLIYLSAQKRPTDDHTIINRQWPSFWKFLTSPPRKH